MIQPARALVTGGAGTLGQAIARALLNRGIGVVLTDRDRAALDAARERLGKLPALHCRVLDVTDFGAWTALAEDLDAAGLPIGLLVNNACLPSARLPLIEIGPDQWSAMLAVGLTGAFFGVRAFAPAMITRGWGHILNIGSLAALGPLTCHGDYAATKAGLVSLSETLRAELAGSGVQVSVACPGPIGRRVGNRGQAGEPMTAAGRMEAFEGMDHVIEAMLAGRFFIMTHPSGRAAAERRSEELLAAFNGAMDIEKS